MPEISQFRVKTILPIGSANQLIGFNMKQKKDSNYEN